MDETPGARLKRARQVRGWTQQDLGDRVKKPTQVISRHENTGSIGRPALRAYARALQVSEEWLTYGVGHPPDSGWNAAVDQYLSTEMGKDCPADVAARLRTVDYEALGARTPSAKVVARVRDLIELNKNLGQNAKNGGDTD